MANVNLYQRFRYNNAELLTFPITIRSAADAGVDGNAPRDIFHSIVTSGRLTLPADKLGHALVFLQASSLDATCTHIDIAVDDHIVLSANSDLLEWAGFLAPRGSTTWTLSAHNANNQPVPVLLTTQWVELNEEQCQRFVFMRHTWVRTLVGNVWITSIDIASFVEEQAQDGEHILRKHTVLSHRPTNAELDAAALANVRKCHELLQVLGARMVVVLDQHTFDDVAGQWEQEEPPNGNYV